MGQCEGSAARPSLKGKRAQTLHYNFSISLASTADEPVPAAGAVCILETTIVDQGLGTSGTDSGVSLSKELACSRAGLFTGI